jgi:hypothetical protein
MDAPGAEKIALVELQRRFETRVGRDSTNVSIREVVIRKDEDRWTVAGIVEVWSVVLAGEKPWWILKKNWRSVHIPTRTKVFEFTIDDMTGQIIGINLDMMDRYFPRRT